MKASHFLLLVNKMCSHEDEHFCFVTFSSVSCILHLTFYVNGSCVTWAVFLWNELITSPIQLPFYRFSDLYMSRVTNLSRYSLNQVGIYQWECLNIVNNFVLLTPLTIPVLLPAPRSAAPRVQVLVRLILSKFLVTAAAMDLVPKFKEAQFLVMSQILFYGSFHP